MATNGLTIQEAMEIAMDRRVSAIDAKARDEGHTPGRWDYGTDDDSLTAANYCETCGADIAVRISPGRGENEGREWWAGKMRLWKCPTPTEEVSV